MTETETQQCVTIPVIINTLGKRLVMTMICRVSDGMSSVTEMADICCAGIKTKLYTSLRCTDYKLVVIQTSQKKIRLSASH